MLSFSQTPRYDVCRQKLQSQNLPTNGMILNCFISDSSQFQILKLFQKRFKIGQDGQNSIKFLVNQHEEKKTGRITFAGDFDRKIKAFPYSSDSATHLTELILKYQKHQTRGRVFEQSLDALESSSKGTPPQKFPKGGVGGSSQFPKPLF